MRKVKYIIIYLHSNRKVKKFTSTIIEVIKKPKVLLR